LRKELEGLLKQKEALILKKGKGYKERD